MKYLELLTALRRNKLVIFSLNDAGNLFPDEKLRTLKNNLSRWTKSRHLVRLRKNLYEFVEPGGESEVPDVYIANKLYLPSYVSLETALSIYGLIPEFAAQVVSVTTKPTRKFKNRHGTFFYRTCRSNAFIGYRLLLYENFKICIADREKAVTDFLYFNSRKKNILDFKEERFSKKVLRQLDWKKAFRYAGLFNKKTLGDLKRLKRWVRC
jgi:predicted transcriptional regulator of viral defense system